MLGHAPAATAPPTALLLDLDDTILDCTGGADSSWRTVCEAASHRVPGLDPAALFRRDGRSTPLAVGPAGARPRGPREASRRIAHRVLASLGFDLPELARWTAETYRGLREQTIPPNPRRHRGTVCLQGRGHSTRPGNQRLVRGAAREDQPILSRALLRVDTGGGRVRGGQAGRAGIPARAGWPGCGARRGVDGRRPPGVGRGGAAAAWGDGHLGGHCGTRASGVEPSPARPDHPSAAGASAVGRGRAARPLEGSWA